MERDQASAVCHAQAYDHRQEAIPFVIFVEFVALLICLPVLCLHTRLARIQPMRAFSLPSFLDLLAATVKVSRINERLPVIWKEPL
jgi:hypothetical protein